jgi:hypothetical protein
LYSAIDKSKKGYQPRTTVIKYEKGDLVTDFHRIWARWMNHFSQLLNVLGVNDVRQTEIHTAEHVPELSALEVELIIERAKKSQITRY